MKNAYRLELDIEDEDIKMIHDIIRMVTIQLITHILLSLTNNEISLFNLNFVKVTIYIIISVMFYWFVVNKYVIIKKRLFKENKK